MNTYHLKVGDIYYVHGKQKKIKSFKEYSSAEKDYVGESGMMCFEDGSTCILNDETKDGFCD